MEGIKGDTCYLNDPAMGRRTVPWAEFRTSYTGVAMKIVTNENFKLEGRHYNIFKAVYEKLMQDKWAALFIFPVQPRNDNPRLSVALFSQIFLDDILTRKHPDWRFNLWVKK